MTKNKFKNELIDLAEKRGFVKFMTKTFDKVGWLFIHSESYISLHLYEDGWFELTHTIPNTIIQLKSDGRRNFEKDEYFNEIYQQFESLVKACYIELGIVL